MNEIEYWKIIVMGIAIASFLFDVLKRKPIDVKKAYVRSFVAMVLVLLSILIRSDRNNADWILTVFAVSIGLGSFVNIFRSKKQTPNQRVDLTR